MPTDYEIVRTMEIYGGSFVQALARCFICADPGNIAKLKAAFPEYWAEYAEMTEIVKAQQAKAAR